MAFDIHRRLIAAGAVVCVGLVAVLVVAYRSIGATYDVPPDADVFAAVQGTWAWTTAARTCDTAPHAITFSPDHAIMFITPLHPWHLPGGQVDSVAVYDVLAHTRHSIRGAIRGETRLTDSGKPVVWDLVLQSPDRYTWHRTDWNALGFTAAIARCPNPLRHVVSQDSIRTILAQIVPVGTPLRDVAARLWHAGVICSQVKRMSFGGYRLVEPNGASRTVRATQGVDCELRPWDQPTPPWPAVFFVDSAGVVVEEQVMETTRPGRE